MSRFRSSAALLAASLFALVSLSRVPAVGAPQPPAQPPPPPQPQPSVEGGEEEAPGARIEGRWLGVVRLPNSQTSFVVTFAPPDESGLPSNASIDIPAQQLLGAPLTDLILDGRQVSFTLDTGAEVNAIFDLQLTPEGDAMEGLITQGEGVFPARLRRAGPGEGLPPARPQNPTPPLPYREIEVSFTNPGDGVTLAATLTLPEGDGPHPAAILLSGSGPQDRDATIAGHKPFLVIADHLTRNGIAVLRSDDRGVGGSGGDAMRSTIDDFAADTLAAIDHLRARAEIDPDAIGLIGHSEGGGVAAKVAGEAPDRVRFLILLASMGVRGDEVLLSQMRTIAERSGLPEEVTRAQLESQRALLERITSGASADELRPLIERSIRAQTRGRLPDEAVARQTEAQLNALTSPWFRHLMSFDPRPHLARVECPVLALGGSLDVQVLPELNLGAIESALREGGNEDVSVRTLEDLNHLFQPAETGLLNEYARIETTFDPGALDLVTRWLRERLAP